MSHVMSGGRGETLQGAGLIITIIITIMVGYLIMLHGVYANQIQDCCGTH